MHAIDWKRAVSVSLIPQVSDAVEVQVINERQNVEGYVKATPAKINEFQAAYDKHDAQLQNGLRKMVPHFLRKEFPNNTVDRRDRKK